LLLLGLEAILLDYAFQAQCQWLATVFKPTAAEVRAITSLATIDSHRVWGRVSPEASSDVCVWAKPPGF